MRRLPPTLAAGLLLSLSGLGTACAHHSFAMYDQTKVVTLQGTVKTFGWTNPHAVIVLLGWSGPEKGEPQLWSIELSTSPGNLSRMGWSKHSLESGDKVSVEISPMRDGRHAGSLKKVVVAATGKVLTTTPVAGQIDAKPDAK